MMSVDSAGKAAWIRAQEEQELLEARGINRSKWPRVTTTVAGEKSGNDCREDRGLDAGEVIEKDDTCAYLV